MSKQGTLTMAAVLLMALTGCSKSGASRPTDSAPGVSEAHSHEGWWCEEHGVPEDVCGLCSTKLAAEFKAKGDWCRDHDRPESQCFICHPEKEAEFAAQYEAKTGKKPPAPADSRETQGSAEKNPES